MMKFFFLFILYLISSLSGISQKVNAVEKEGLYGFFSSDSMILGFQFDSVRNQLDGYFTVYKKGGWGLVDSYGKQILPCTYEKIYLFSHRLYSVTFNGLTGLVDTTGSIFLDLLYDKIDHIESDTQILLKHQGKWSLYKEGQHDYNQEKFVYFFPDYVASLPGCFHGSRSAPEHKICAYNTLLEYLNASLKYPYKAIRKGTQGRVWVRFVISSQGRVESPEILAGIGDNCDQEVLRVLSEMPIWIPGTLDGSYVKSLYLFPVDFQLTN